MFRISQTEKGFNIFKSPQFGHFAVFLPYIDNTICTKLMAPQNCNIT